MKYFEVFIKRWVDPEYVSIWWLTVRAEQERLVPELTRRYLAKFFGPNASYELTVFTRPTPYRDGVSTLFPSVGTGFFFCITLGPNGQIELYNLDQAIKNALPVETSYL